MIKMSAALVLFFSSVFSLTVCAKNVPAKTYTFADNDTIPVKLSSINLNRLVVKNDKILALTCPVGFCTSHGNKNDKSGSITVKVNIALPFTAHISTQNGRNFALFINPKPTPAIVSEFVGVENRRKQPSVFTRGFDYPVAIAEFTKAMINWTRFKTDISGFSVHHVDKNTLPKDKSPLAIIPQTVFVGKDYSGIIYELVNQSSNRITLSTAQFYSYAARSASLEKDSLSPGERTLLYVVTGGGISHVQ